MEKINLNEYLAANEYPGRGIAVAKAPDGRQMFIGYFIMGRNIDKQLAWPVRSQATYRTGIHSVTELITYHIGVVR